MPMAPSTKIGMNSLGSGVAMTPGAKESPTRPRTGCHPMSVLSPAKNRSANGTVQKALTANPTSQLRTRTRAPRRRSSSGSETITTTIVVTTWLSTVSASTTPASGLGFSSRLVSRITRPR